MMKTIYILTLILFCVSNILTAQNLIARDDYDTVDINTTLNVPASEGVLVNDVAANSLPFDVISYIFNGLTYLAGAPGVSPQGTITILADGSFSFVPTAGYTGSVNTITYTISDGTTTTAANLFLSVEPTTDLLRITSGSCNQGYSQSGEYKILYSITLRNASNARDYHENNLIRNIDLTSNLNAIFGNGCVNSVDNVSISTSQTRSFVNTIFYPSEFSDNALNPDFVNITSNSFFNANAINNLILYPRQIVTISFCINVNPFCNGRPNPTPSGSGIDFDTIFDVSSTIGNDTTSITLTDFHTTNAVVTAGFYIPVSRPPANPDGTYQFTNTVVITNEGSATANNVNYNMGFRSFLDNGITFNQLVVSQLSGPNVIINPSFNGNTDTQLLAANNSLAPNETIVLQVFHLTNIVASNSNIVYNQLDNSQTQGGLDGFDESTPLSKTTFSFVSWTDTLGDHLDRYYPISGVGQVVPSNAPCTCEFLNMVFSFTSSSATQKIISNTNAAPNGVLENQEVTFQITGTNTSSIVQLTNLQLQDNLNTICGGNIINVSTPIILSTSTANILPTINSAFNGITNINIFNGTTGLLNANEFVTVEFTVLFKEDCVGTNFSDFRGTDPLNNLVNSLGEVRVEAFTDSDGDAIGNFTDLDDDNDTIPDILEYNGLDPLADHDNDLTPNYRDTNFGIDANNDGIVDIFDFDGDGVPNHFDLDSDNDGIFDIVEAGNIILDTDTNGRTNNAVGVNGLDNTIETTDNAAATITYAIPNTDANGNPNYLDIDSDNDGIVDIIEAQTSDNYLAPSGIINIDGIDNNYPNGINPVDTDSDGLFDYIDINSDNDIRNDIIEGWDFNNDGIAETAPTNSDNDNDGLDDAFDTNDNLVNPTNGQTPLSFPNADNTDTPQRDWREIIAIFVRIENASITEGGDLIFNVRLETKNNSAILVQSTTDITINLTTTNGTTSSTLYDIATAPFDYNPINNIVLTIPAFTDTSQIIVTTLDDNIYELNELLTLNGAITSNNTLNTQTNAVGTIIDNELPPNITMNNAIANEGENLEYTISISHPSSTPININIVTSNNTAISPNDYTAISTNLTINGTVDPANANTQASFNVATNTDNLNESDQELLNVIGSVTSLNVGTQDLVKTGTIVDIDPDPIVAINNVQAVEGMPLIFTITLLNANGEPMQNYIPININLETIDVTTTSNLDYQNLIINTSIPENTFSITQNIETFDDKLIEYTETLQLQVDILSAGVSNTTPIIFGEGYIDDNDFPNLFSPNSDGLSDTFKIINLEGFPNFKLIIMDRWGSEVYNYSNNGSLNPTWWDGNYKGKPVIEGVYFYTLDYNDGVTAPKTNFIQLIR